MLLANIEGNMKSLHAVISRHRGLKSKFSRERLRMTANHLTNHIFWKKNVKALLQNVIKEANLQLYIKAWKKIVVEFVAQ